MTFQNKFMEDLKSFSEIEWPIVFSILYFRSVNMDENEKKKNMDGDNLVLGIGWWVLGVGIGCRCWGQGTGDVGRWGFAETTINHQLTTDNQD